MSYSTATCTLDRRRRRCRTEGESCLWLVSRSTGTAIPSVLALFVASSASERGGTRRRRVSLSLCLSSTQKIQETEPQPASIVGRSVGPLFSGLPVPAPVAESAPAPWSFRSCAACAAAARDKNRLRNEPRGSPPARRDGRDEREEEGGREKRDFRDGCVMQIKMGTLARFLCAACGVHSRIFRTFFSPEG